MGKTATQQTAREPASAEEALAPEHSPRSTVIKAVIFDVDGTLVDSNDFHVKAWQRAFRHYGKELGYAELHTQIGKGGDQLMPVFCSRQELESYGAELERLRGKFSPVTIYRSCSPFHRCVHSSSGSRQTGRALRSPPRPKGRRSKSTRRSSRSKA